MAEVLNKTGCILLEIKEGDPVGECVGDGLRKYGLDCIEDSDKPDSRRWGSKWPDVVILDIYIYRSLKWFILQ